MVQQTSTLKQEYTNNITNSIIEGDNKIILKRIAPSLKNKVKCVYIDPPYNNKEKHYDYDDNKSHEDWLANMEDTLRLIKPLIKSNGSIWISIDDQEMHYLKVVADKVFGRENFINTIAWQQRKSRENRSIFSNNQEYILVYAINPKEFKKTRNLLPLTETILKRYKNPDNDNRGSWQSISANVQAGHATKSQFYSIIAPSGKVHGPPKGRCWVYNETKMKDEINNNNIWFGKEGNGVPRIKKFLNGAKKGLTPETLWLADFAGTNNSAKKHFLSLFPKEKLFDTPKPEELIHKIIAIATNEGDLVLDCFLGAGSTVSTAHKMNRKYIGIEKESPIAEIAKKRLELVIEGEKGGISENVDWSGGGKFKYIQMEKIMEEDDLLIVV